jgi:23S rRNA-/tRNA-specific pseudouridylate synthase
MDSATWLEIELQTGRTHQIRLQTAARGYPVVGDFQYGSKADFGPLTEDLRERWIALHARSLSFRHPMNRLPVTVLAPLPPAWKEWGVDVNCLSNPPHPTDLSDPTDPAVR